MKILLHLFLSPFKSFFWIWLAIGRFQAGKKDTLFIELPFGFSISDSPFWVRLIRPKAPLPGRVPYLRTISEVAKIPSIKTIAFYIPKLEWNLADTFEFIEVLEHLKQHGKKTIGFCESGNLQTLLLLSQLDEVAGSEFGEFQIQLPVGETFFYQGILEKFGIEIEAFASGAYKSFAESFTRKSFTKPAKENLSTLLNAFQNLIYETLSKNSIRKEAFFPPILSTRELKITGFLNEVISKKDWRKRMENKLEIKHLKKLLLDSKEFFFPSKKHKVLIIPMLGGIVEGDPGEENIYENSISKEAYANFISEIREDNSIGSILLEIDSPGGSALASEELYCELQSIEKPIYAYTRSMAASGGYYLAIAGKKIFSNPISILGSIGAVLVRPNFKKAMSKNSIQTEVLIQRPLSEIFRFTEPLTKKSKDFLSKEIKRIETQFYQRVMQSRSLSPEEMDRFGGGRVFLTSTANKLIDGQMGILGALQQIKKDLGVSKLEVETLRLQKKFGNKLIPQGLKFNGLLFYSLFGLPWTMVSNRSKRDSELELISGISRNIFGIDLSSH